MSDANSAPEESFTDEQVNEAIKAFLEYGAESFVGDGEMNKGHRGYYSGAGWSARCLAYHLKTRTELK